jgi:precorrin-6Y C5,15-methyltransferase (decarboxylating)
LTDQNNSPAKLALFLLETAGKKNADRYDFYVAENIGQEDERLTTGKLSNIATGRFSDLSVVIILDQGEEGALGFGLREEEITHSRGLITKNEVRAATLHALRLPKSGVFWDIGSGSGSLSIEAASISPELSIYSVETKTEQIENIQKNRERYLAYTVQPVMGNAPEILLDLPDPDRIFVGGSGGKLREILEYSSKRLRPAGVLVVNGVLEKTCRQAPDILNKLGFEVLISTIQVTRSLYPGQVPVEFNPISIITGRKTKQ